MLRFVLRRLVLLVPVMMGILLVTFTLLRLIPGDPCKVMLGERATEAKCAAFRERFGLDDPIPVQFVRYVGSVLQGDLGTSIKTGRPVVEVVAERLPMTLELTLCATLFAVSFGVLLGVISAVKHNSLVDVGAMVLANLGVSMPVFWLGLMLAYVFALALRGTPFQLPPLDGSHQAPICRACLRRGVWKTHKGLRVLRCCCSRTRFCSMQRCRGVGTCSWMHCGT